MALTVAQVYALLLAARQRADHAYATASRAIASTRFAGREAPTVVAGPPTTLTVINTPVSDASCTVWRGAADGFAMTEAWTRVGNVFTLTNQRVDVNEAFRISYFY